MRLSHELLLKYPEEGGVAAWERVWRTLRGIYRGEYAETRASRWWSRRDRRMAQASLRLIEAGAAREDGRPFGLEPPVVWNDELRRFESLAQKRRAAAGLASGYCYFKPPR